MIEPSRKAYKSIQTVAKLIHDELETQIEPSSIRLSLDQLPTKIPESEFEEALKYLSAKSLISYKCDKTYSAAYDEYNEEYKKAYDLAQSPEYIFTTNTRKQDEIWKQVNLYNRLRKNEAKRSCSTVFIIKPLPSFEAEYKEILSKYSDAVRYKLMLGGSEKNILCVNNRYRLHRFNAEWQLQLMKRALSDTNEAYIEAPKGAKKGMPQLIPDIIESPTLRDLFFPERKKGGFVIRHTITDEMIKAGQLDTKKIESELRKTHTNAK